MYYSTLQVVTVRLVLYEVLFQFYVDTGSQFKIYFSLWITVIKVWKALIKSCLLLPGISGKIYNHEDLGGIDVEEEACLKGVAQIT